MLIDTVKQAKRVIVAVVGFTLLLLGIVLFFTPGPGFAVILLGLTVLGAEFVWARRLLKRLKKAGTEFANGILHTLHVTTDDAPAAPHRDEPRQNTPN